MSNKKLNLLMKKFTDQSFILQIKLSTTELLKKYKNFQLDS